MDITTYNYVTINEIITLITSAQFVQHQQDKISEMSSSNQLKVCTCIAQTTQIHVQKVNDQVLLITASYIKIL